MGFEPQTADQPIVNVHKRTTKVNFYMAAGIALFLAIGIAFMLWAAHRSEKGAPIREEPRAGK